MKHGNGKKTYDDGKYYNGEWKYNKKYGNGIMYSKDHKVLFKGEWKEEEKTGGCGV